MWVSADQAMALLRAAARDVEHAREKLRQAEELRNVLLVQLHGQELSYEPLAVAAGVSRSSFYRLIGEAEPVEALPLVPTPSEVRAALIDIKPANRITETRRVRVA